MPENLEDNIKNLREEAIEAGIIGAQNLIKVAQADIMQPKAGDPLAADKLKNAAQAIKLSLFDCFEILNRVAEERRLMDAAENEDTVDAKPKSKIDEQEIDDFKLAEGRAK